MITIALEFVCYDSLILSNRYSTITFKMTTCMYIHNNPTMQLVKTTLVAEDAVGVIVWSMDLLLPMQSVPITTNVVSSNRDQGEVYNIM